MIVIAIAAGIVLAFALLCILDGALGAIRDIRRSSVGRGEPGVLPVPLPLPPLWPQADLGSQTESVQTDQSGSYPYEPPRLAEPDPSVPDRLTEVVPR